VTSFARLDGNVDGSRLAQVLDVEQILRDVLPSTEVEINESGTGRIILKPGTKVLAADDSGVARSLIEQSLSAMGVQFIMTKSGQEAWNVLEDLQSKAEKHGRCAADEIALVLTDLEMPEMDGFTLTPYQGERRHAGHSGRDPLVIVRVGERGARAQGGRERLCVQVCRGRTGGGDARCAQDDRHLKQSLRIHMHKHKRPLNSRSAGVCAFPYYRTTRPSSLARSRRHVYCRPCA
jgi:CheY-like chemotaxis protein